MCIIKIVLLVPGHLMHSVALLLNSYFDLQVHRSSWHSVFLIVQFLLSSHGIV